MKISELITILRKALLEGEDVEITITIEETKETRGLSKFDIDFVRDDNERLTGIDISPYF